jgi:hypothetical protein
MLHHLFGTDRLTFTLTSNTPQAIQKTRIYNRLSDAADDVVDARVYLGIHFRFADEVARDAAEHVSNWAFGHFLKPRNNGE